MPNTTTQAKPSANLVTWQNKTKWLHVSEAFDIGKLRFHAGYRTNGKATAQTLVYLDIPAARALFDAILRFNGRVDQKDHTYFGGSTRNGKTESRRMQVGWDDTKDKNPVGFHFKVGPGVRGKNGAVMPDSKAKPEETTAVSIFLDLPGARAMAAEILAQLLAYDVNNFAFMIQERRAETADRTGWAEGNEDSAQANPAVAPADQPSGPYQPEGYDDDIFAKEPPRHRKPQTPKLDLVDEGTLGTLENLLLQTYQDDDEYTKARADIFAQVKAGRGAEIDDTTQLTQAEALALIKGLGGAPNAPTVTEPETVTDEDGLETPF